MTKWEQVSEHEWQAVTAGLSVIIANGYIGGGDEYRVSCQRLGLQHMPTKCTNLADAQAKAEVILIETIADRVRAVANLKEGK